MYVYSFVVPIDKIVFADILQFIHRSTNFDAEDLEEVVRHMGDMNLVTLQDDLKQQSSSRWIDIELLAKFIILGVKKEKVSRLIAPWQALKLKPDFILLAKMFRKGSHHFYKIGLFSNQLKRKIFITNNLYKDVLKC